EVRPLEAQRHQGHEREGRDLGRQASPEPVVDAEVAVAMAERLDVRGVPAHVAEFVSADRDQSPTKGRGRLRMGEDRPAHQLRRLELVMQKGVQELRALAMVSQRLEAWSLSATLDDVELGRPSWSLDVDRLERFRGCPVGRRWRWPKLAR